MTTARLTTVVLAVILVTAGPGGLESMVTTRARCSMVWPLPLPSVLGRRAFLLAEATDSMITVASPHFRGFTVRAQLMRIDSVAGYRSDTVRRALQSGDRTAVFVRYWIDPSCGPYASRDGDPDSAGVSGLYVGVPREPSAWVGGRPTIDVYLAKGFPLPSRRWPSRAGDSVAPQENGKDVMTAVELFGLYRSLWNEAAVARDTTLRTRIRAWAARNPLAARKHPVSEIVQGAILDIEHASTYERPVPFAGTFRVNVDVPDAGSMTVHLEIASAPEPAGGRIVRDSASGLALGLASRSFWLRGSMGDSSGSFRPANLCGHVSLIAAEMPIILRPDSSWEGTFNASPLAACAPRGSPLSRSLSGMFARGATQVTYTPARFRVTRDGRVTLEAHGTRDGRSIVTMSGERVSIAAFRAGPPLRAGEPPP